MEFRIDFALSYKTFGWMWPKIKESILYEIVLCENDNIDVWIEAIYFLSFFDPTFDEGIFIEKVINLQQKDGGWKYYSNSEESNTHTTILALWLLLNYELSEWICSRNISENVAKSYPALRL